MGDGLFGQYTKDSVEDVAIFADSQENRNRLNERWLYVGYLIIPLKKMDGALNQLSEDRQLFNYSGELHFNRLNNGLKATQHAEKTRCANAWLARVRDDISKTFNFFVIGIRRDLLNPSVFGDGKDNAIYNRFFRSALLYILKSFFPGKDMVRVDRIRHDKGRMEHDDLFNWHAIAKINAQEKRIAFTEWNVEFVDSDHRKEEYYPEDSHFIQLIDLITGAVSQCLDNSNRAKGRKDVAREFLPLVERLNGSKRCNNTNSRYCYYRRCAISFFPSKSLTNSQILDEWERASSTFHKDRRLFLKEDESGQVSFEFC